MSRHNNPTYEKRTAVAPYNFVPLPETVLHVSNSNPQDIWGGESGFFDCTLETASPFYIRGMQSSNTNGLPDSKFFSVNNGITPKIPGSSIRGLFRSLLEITTYAKPFAITNEKSVYRSFDTTSHGVKYRNRLLKETEHNQFEPLFKCGYMRYKNGDWYIQPAQEIRGTNFARISHKRIPNELHYWHKCNNVRLIYIKPGDYSYQNIKEGFLKIKYSKVERADSNPYNDLIEAVLSPSGKMFSKKSEAVIFPPDPLKKDPTDWIAIDHNKIDQYRNQLSAEQIKLLGEDGVLQDWYPVFYLLENEELVFFGHPQMLRLPYKKSPWELIEPSLKESREVDLIEDLFGIVHENQKKDSVARAGRIFFSDGECLPNQGNVFEQEITPQLLASPKPTTFQHYLEQPEPDDKESLRDYDDSDSSIRGNKLYWHKGPIKIERIKETDPKKLKHKTQYTQIHPVKEKIQFHFKIRFENLLLEELGALVWILDIARDPSYRLNIGMGKPLGMGAISIQYELTIIDRTAYYKSLFANDKWYVGKKDDKSKLDKKNDSIAAYQEWVLKDELANPERKAKKVSELPRIQILLKMLSWPGPNTTLTRYMEIEHPDPNARNGKDNEYSQRPVLPFPTGVGTIRLKPGAPRKIKNDKGKSLNNNQINGSPILPKEKTVKYNIPEKRDTVKPAANDFMKFLEEQSSEAEKELRRKKKRK